MASPTGQTGKGRYPRQLVIMVTADMGAHIDAVAAENSVSLSEVARTYLDAGREVGEAAAAVASGEHIV